ncbi:MAG: glycerophosphoryl diester phosphodiesterase [Frankiales bacterium]|nr:glycerophosphoryl diester phosphodiesterase [Frankiales bacterium]
MRILAHRGSPTSGTNENTIPAISGALAAGADGVEVDLRMTADGVLAVCHDPDLGRVGTQPLPVSTTGWDELRAAAPGLARVEWVLAAAAGRHVVLELKTAPVRSAQLLVERLLVLHSAGLPLDVTVSSFDAALVRAVRTLTPAHLGLRTALLGDTGCLATAVLRRALLGGHDQVHPHISDLMAQPETVAAARQAGVAVIPWTVNRPEDLRRCALLGVQAVITDVPQEARLALTARRAPA